MLEYLECCAEMVPWLIPLAAVLGLLQARGSQQPILRRWGERVYFAVFLVVAQATLRTMWANDPCWLLHTASLSVMVVGGAMIAIASAGPAGQEQFDW